MSVNSKMTAIADEIRTLSGTTGAMSLDAMANNVNEANTEVNSQAEIMTQIMNALEGKTAGIGSGGSPTFESGILAVTDNGIYEPGTNEYIFSSDALRLTERILVIVHDDNMTMIGAFIRDSIDEEFTVYYGYSQDSMYSIRLNLAGSSSSEILARGVINFDNSNVDDFYFKAI